MDELTGAPWPDEPADGDAGPQDDGSREHGAHPSPPAAVPRPVTGQPGVDAALGPLDQLTGLPVAEHPAVFERVQLDLREVLDELGSGTLTGPGRDDR